MYNMYNTLKTNILMGGTRLSEVQNRIKRLYATGDLTDGQMEELMELSQQKANPEAERPELPEMLRSLAERVEALEKKFASGSLPEEEAPYIEAWKPWDGISNKYQPGAVVSHNGKLWQSVHNGQNVWEPGTVGTASLWVEYTEVNANA